MAKQSLEIAGSVVKKFYDDHGVTHGTARHKGISSIELAIKHVPDSRDQIDDEIKKIDEKLEKAKIMFSTEPNASSSSSTSS